MAGELLLQARKLVTVSFQPNGEQANTQPGPMVRPVLLEFLRSVDFGIHSFRQLWRGAHLDRRLGASYNTIWLCNYMVIQATTSHLNATFAALADPTRRAILARLASGQATVNELAEPFAMTQPAVSKHLRVLERAGLISRDRDAQRRPSRLEPKRLAEASAWLDQYREFWEASFARLDTVLEELRAKKTGREKPSRR